MSIQCSSEHEQLKARLVADPSPAQALAARLANGPAPAYTHVVIEGYATRQTDPLFSSGRDHCRVQKLVRVDAIAGTLLRWSLMGRVIDATRPTTLNI